MQHEGMNLHDQSDAQVVRGAGDVEGFRLHGRYYVECFDSEGKLRWRDHIDNLITDVGARLVLDTILAGSSFTATTYMGLKGAGTPVVGDTQASHASWLEQGLANAPTYTGNRKTVGWNAASGSGAGSRSKAASAAQSFAITSSGTVAGCFININGSATKDDTTGTLLSAGDFSGGSKAVVNGDTINVSFTLSC